MLVRKFILPEVSRALRLSPLFRQNADAQTSPGTSDVLLRHLRNCKGAQEPLERLRADSEKQSRTKKACNICAKSKIKCDSGNPCQRCKQKSLRCEYTRKGYSDPYEAFQVLGQATSKSAPSAPVIDQLVESHAPELQSTHLLGPTPSGSGPSDLDTNTVLTSNDIDMNTSICHVDDFAVPGYVPMDMNVPLEELRWDSLLAFPDCAFDFPDLSDLPALSETTNTSSPSKRAGWQFTEGFQIQQLDSVEAKCVEMRSYLQSIQPGLSDELISKSITRDRLLDCVQLYGKYYHPIMPILHLPTFELTKTTPVLLLAMMLVGNCYGHKMLPAATVLQFAFHILRLIEDSQVNGNHGVFHKIRYG